MFIDKHKIPADVVHATGVTDRPKSDWVRNEPKEKKSHKVTPQPKKKLNNILLPNFRAAVISGQIVFEMELFKRIIFWMKYHRS